MMRIEYCRHLKDVIINGKSHSIPGAFYTVTPFFGFVREKHSAWRHQSFEFWAASDIDRFKWIFLKKRTEILWRVLFFGVYWRFLILSFDFNWNKLKTTVHWTLCFSFFFLFLGGSISFSVEKWKCKWKR